MPAKQQPPTEDKELKLLRLFQYIDSLPPGGQLGYDRYFRSDTIIIDGKTAQELLPQMIELSTRGAFNRPVCTVHQAGSLPYMQIEIYLDGDSIDQWRKQVSSVLGNT